MYLEVRDTEKNFFTHWLSHQMAYISWDWARPELVPRSVLAGSWSKECCGNLSSETWMWDAGIPQDVLTSAPNSPQPFSGFALF